MATVPIIDAPQQELGAGGFQPFAAPGVEPMKNFAPEQMVKQGQAWQAVGQTAMKIGDQIQDQIDDANTKAADSFFTARAQKILLDPEGGYLHGLVKALAGAGDDAEADGRDSLGDDVDPRHRVGSRGPARRQYAGRGGHRYGGDGERPRHANGRAGRGRARR